MNVELQNLSIEEIKEELSKGGKFVTYSWTLSVILMTYKRPANKIYFLKHNDSAIKFGWPYLLLSLILGWWGIPWGPIYTVQAIYQSFTGIDVTDEMIKSINNSED